MRIRTVKPEFWQDEDLSRLPAETHMLAGGLLNYADDEGYFNANVDLVRSAVFPTRQLSVSIHGMLTELSNIGFIELGDAPDGKRYGRVVKFSEHQRVNRPTPSKIKKMRIAWAQSVTTHGGLTEDSLPEGKGKEGKGKEGSEARAHEVSEVTATPPAQSTNGGTEDLRAVPGFDAEESYRATNEIWPRKDERPGDVNLKLYCETLEAIARERRCSVEEAAEWLDARVAERALEVEKWPPEEMPKCPTFTNLLRSGRYQEGLEFWRSKSVAKKTASAAGRPPLFDEQAWKRENGIL